MLIKEKRDGRINGRTSVDGSSQRSYIPPEDAASPIVSTEALMISCAIGASENRCVATCGIVEVYLHTNMTKEIYMVIRVKMVDMLVVENNEKYKQYVPVTKRGGQILY